MAELQKGYIAVSKESKKALKENFTSEVNDDFITFPKELGVEHPFNFADMEHVYCKNGLVYGAVKRYVHSIIGEFDIKAETPAAEELLKSFAKETQLKQVITEWLIEGFVKGNGFIELDLKKKQIKVVNANNMYVVRNRKGEVMGYNQYIGDKSKYNFKKIVPLTPDKVVHIKINPVADSAYGYGILSPNELNITNIISAEQGMHKLLERKAGAPLHFQVGQPGESVNPSVISQVQQDLQYLTNKTEWVTDGNVKIDVVDFHEVGKNFQDLLAHDMLMFSYGTLIPESMFGKGNLPEGLADNNAESWKQLISSYQDILENLIENKIFKPYLLANGMDVGVDFTWNLPTDKDIDARLTQLNAIISNMNIDENIRRAANREIAKLMQWEDALEVLDVPSPNANEERMKQKAKEEQMKQPMVPGQKRESLSGVTAKAQMPHEHQDGKFNSSLSDDNLNIIEYANMNEIHGFNYTEYVQKILQVLNDYPFDNLKAEDAKQLEMGLLPDSDIEKLRKILSEGFRENKSIAQIKAQIKEEIRLSDRLDNKGNLLLTAEERPGIIARTETITIANQGLKQLYKDNGIKRVRWLAAVSERTCEECQNLNGRVFNINEIQTGVDQPPLHPNCRCTLLSVLE